MNLYDAILLGTKGIGVWTWIECTVLQHEVECQRSFSLVKHPELMEICRKNIAIEVCPIS